MWVTNINELKNSSPKILDYWMKEDINEKINLPREDCNYFKGEDGKVKTYTKLSSNNIMKK